MSEIDPQQIIDFWFSERVKPLWFNSTPAFDQELKSTYQALWQQAADGELDHWLQSPSGCLALVLVLDQFPLNMFRQQKQSFQTELQSRQVADRAIDMGFDQLLTKEQKAFLYMPFMHSEYLSDQDLSVHLFEAAELEDNLKFAKHHRQIIRDFGRFPHRNNILGRESTKAELDYLKSDQAFKG